MKKGRNREKSLARIIWGWLFFIFMMMVVVFLAMHIVGHRTRVMGNSMYPTLAEGDSIVLDRITYRFFNPRRYDLIVFPFQYQPDTYYVKRIIGLPGETVQIMDGAIYINGTQLKEPHDFGEILSGGLAAGQITLGDDEYFVLGDNRNESSDSREPTVGNIRREDILGRAFLRVLPLERFGLLR